MSMTDTEAREETDLDARIGVQHDRIAVLMHERNARPEDDEIVRKLQSEFETLRALQRKKVPAHRAPPVAEETDPTIERAREIVERYISEEFEPKISIEMPRTDEEKKTIALARARAWGLGLTMDQVRERYASPSRDAADALAMCLPECDVGQGMTYDEWIACIRVYYPAATDDDARAAMQKAVLDGLLLWDGKEYLRAPRVAGGYGSEQ